MIVTEARTYYENFVLPAYCKISNKLVGVSRQDRDRNVERKNGELSEEARDIVAQVDFVTLKQFLTFFKLNATITKFITFGVSFVFVNICSHKGHTLSLYIKAARLLSTLSKQ